MSYGNYNQGGYGQQNPYDQRDNYAGAGAGAGAGGYGGGGYTQAGYGQGNGYNNDVEMQPIADQGAGYGQSMPRGDPNAILNDCQNIDRSIDDLERQLDELQRAQKAFVEGRVANREIDQMGTDIMDAYRALGQRVKKLKSMPDSASARNSPQVGRVDRRLKKAINDYQKVESQFRKSVQEQQARQYRIVNPNATEEEVREATENPNTQIFQQALMNSDRRGQAQSTLNQVRERHDAIQNIERTMIELAQLFQDLETIVVQQEPLVEHIEQKGEEIQENIVKGNVELDAGIKSARAARKKKWCLFWFCIILILVIIAAVVAWYFAAGPGSNKNPAPKLKF